jgi:AcrR family transcriptional regulator
MGKGADTRERILDRAMAMASRDGLGELSIGKLAAALPMSKAGLFAHFGSKEALEGAVLDYAAERQRRLAPAPTADGREALRRLFVACLDWIDDTALAGGCPIIKACFEFAGRADPTGKKLRKMQRGFQRRLADLFRAATPAGTDVEQRAFEFRAITLAYQHARYAVGDPRARDRALRSFQALMARGSA